uniref:Uncharacterized protein n=1 Tax=Oryza glumipatula TaxID=40148 RepID=A0A0E0AJC2_9ORYZ
MASLVDKPFINKPFGLFSGEFVRRHGFHLLGTTSTWLLDAVPHSRSSHGISSQPSFLPP